MPSAFDLDVLHLLAQPAADLLSPLDSRAAVVGLAAAAALYVGKKTPTRWVGALVLALSTVAADQLTVHAVEPIFLRQRPCDGERPVVPAPLGCPPGGSFPSRTGAGAGAAALVFASAAPILSGVAVGVALLVCAAEVHDGAAWPSDEVAGLALGAAMAALALSLSKLKFLHPRHW